MSAPLKIHLPKIAYFVTSRTQTGLPFVATEHLKLILNGIMARASEQHDVTICHYLWMANHFHFVVVIDNPEALSSFIGYIKTESSHMVNNLLGRNQQSIWVAGSDTPLIGGVDDAIERISYLYANPAKANLVDTIADYPMLSSWEMYQQGNFTKECEIIRRPETPFTGPARKTPQQQRAITEALKEVSSRKATLSIAPNAWMKCFPELDEGSLIEIESRIHKAIEAREEEARKLRAEKQRESKHKHLRGVTGAEGLTLQRMDKPHTPKAYGKKMICICADKEKRLQILTWAFELMAKARAVYAKWKQGDFSEDYPPGMYAPRPPRRLNIFPLALTT